VLETGENRLEKSWPVWVHRTVRWCTGQCPVRQASLGEQAALGTQWRRTAIIHRTVRWCTGLSGGAPDCPVSRPRWSRRSREKFNGVRLKFTGLSGGAPDCPVSQQSTAQRSTAKSAGDAWPALMVGRGHRTVRCAPDSVRCANCHESATVPGPVF
jgi:hypothetical protein